VGQLKTYFERNGNIVDAELRSGFVASIPRTVAASPLVNEITEQQLKQVKVQAIGWEPLPKDSDSFVKLSKMFVEGQSNPWSKATATVDVKPEEALAYFWYYCSNERISAVKNLPCEPRDVITVNEANNHQVISTIKELPSSLLQNRQLVFEAVWTPRPSNGGYVYAWRPTSSYSDNHLIDIGRNKQRRLIRGESRGYVLIQSNSNSSYPSTKIAYLQQTDFKGNVPVRVLSSTIPKTLNSVFQIREKFSRDEEVDKMERDKLTSAMRKGQEEYNPSELALFNNIRFKLTKLDDRLHLYLFCSVFL